MDMKKILQAFDGATSKPKVQGVHDMSRFVSIIKEGATVDNTLDNKNRKTEAIVTGFEEGSLGGDANGFLLAADNINDLVMSNVDKIKINANEEKLKDMMSKFNAFMSAYHAVGKEILQPEMFGESNAEVDEARYNSRDAYQRDYDSSRTGFGKNSRAYQADGGANDEYNTPEYDPAFEKNKQESTMYNIKVDGKVINPKPILGRTNAIQWAKGQAETAGLDLKTAMLSQVKYGESVESEPGVAEAYDHNAPFNAADFNRHMDRLRAREELRKTDPMKALVGDMIDKDREKEALAKRKKPEDDSLSTSDPRHPQYSYTQAGQQGVAEGEQRMSRAAKGNEKYGKDGMKALAKAGRDGASEEKMDKIRDKYDNYNENLSFKDYLSIAESKNKG